MLSDLLFQLGNRPAVLPPGRALGFEDKVEFGGYLLHQGASGMLSEFFESGCFHVQMSARVEGYI